MELVIEVVAIVAVGVGLGVLLDQRCYLRVVIDLLVLLHLIDEIHFFVYSFFCYIFLYFMIKVNICEIYRS